MVSASDFILIPYTPDLTLAGVAYTCHWLTHSHKNIESPIFPNLRRIVADKALELAFRHHLVEYHIPHKNLSSPNFTDPDRYTITLGGRRCDLHGFLLSQKNIIRRVHGNFEELLKAVALIPSEQFVGGTHSDHDLYVFGFVTALVTTNQHELMRALDKNQSNYLIYLLPKSWSNPDQWVTLGKLALKSENIQPITLVMGGQIENMQSQTQEVMVPPGLRVEIQNDFYSLVYMHVSPNPNGRVGVHSPRLSQTIIIQPNDWGNIWLYGMEVILCGYITHGEFRQHAHELPAGSRVLQSLQAPEKSLGLSIASIHPMEELFELATTV